ncbi:hypothetical protein [Pseudomonas khavaziana]|uniref:Uncharacterized protein n=1 Tax=Pseudomonas khavaziana TaxID=2842351 RepID=A0ABZ2DGF6_9PSED
MILSMSAHTHLRTKHSKIGGLLESIAGGSRGISPIPTRTLEAPKVGETPAGSRSGSPDQTLDQAFIDSKVAGFDGPGHTSGARLPGEAGQGNVHQSPAMAEYRARQQKEWQARKDAQARDKLFDQPTAGRVDGQEVEPFSAAKLEKNADELVKAKETALPPTNKTLLKTAAITTAISAPFSTMGLFIAGTANEALKPVINPPPATATVQSVEEGRIVDHIQSSVFKIVNTLGELRNEEPVPISVKWLMLDNDTRLDALGAMLDFAEGEFAKEAHKHNISFQPAFTGAEEDDIKPRAIAMEARMATLTALMGSLKSKIAAGTV